MSNKIAVYAGTFDPPTFGHTWMIRTAAQMFDKLIVAVGVNPSKKTMFSLEERIEMLRNCAKKLSSNYNINITVDSFENKYLIDYADSVKAKYIIRGIRNSNDYEYEKAMRYINGDMHNGALITSVFLMPPREMAEISSSVVKGLIGPDYWPSTVQKYVSKGVLNNIYSNRYPIYKNLVSAGAKVDEIEFWDTLKIFFEATRCYHGLSHIEHLLREFNECKHLLNDKLAVEMAIWFHDLVQTTDDDGESMEDHPNEKTAEEVSAKLAKKVIVKMGLSDTFGEKVNNLILATQHNMSEIDNDCKYMVDMDLSIFGQSEKVFDQYERLIRIEYSRIKKDVFNKGRKEILQRFLDKPNIYYTDYFRNKYELIARNNLKRSIEKLS